MKDKEKCPVCGCEKYEHVIVDNSFCLGKHGSIDIICCTNCGVLRVSKESIKLRLKDK